MSRLVTIYGGSGFIGRYIARRMSRRGWRVRVAVRNTNDAGFVRTYGVVGQVVPVFCNILDDTSVAAAMHDSDAVVNCVGILSEWRSNRFDAIQAEGAGRIARIAAEQGIPRMVHISAIGADPESRSDYARTKAMGEEAVLRHMPDAVILRPSLVFGPEDRLFNRFATMSRLSPVLPIAGGKSRFQPVYVDDVAAAAEKGVIGEAGAGIYELGGPEVTTFRELMERMLTIIRRRRMIVNLPFWLGRVIAAGLSVLQWVSFGLFRNDTLTFDQLRNLARDNVVGEGSNSLRTLGIRPTPMQAVLPEYLWRFRRGGQYADLHASTRDQLSG